MSLSKDDVSRVADLAKLALSDDEIEMYRGQLSTILDNFAILDEIDVSAVSPTAQVVPLENVWREDEVTESLASEVVLAGAPQVEDSFVRVRAVLE